MGQREKEKERQRQTALAKKKITQSHQPPPKKEPTTPKSNLSSVSPSQTTELSKTDQTSMPIIRGETPARDQKEQQQFSGLSLVIIGALLAGLITLAISDIQTRGDLTSAQNNLTKEKEHSRALENNLNIALTQNEIFKLLGPNIISYEHYTVSEKPSPTERQFGSCPEYPCYTAQYKGIGKTDQETNSSLVWSLRRNRRQAEGNDLEMAIRVLALQGCYQKIILPEHYAVVFVLQRIIAPEIYLITMGLINTDPNELEPELQVGRFRVPPFNIQHGCL